MQIRKANKFDAIEIHNLENLYFKDSSLYSLNQINDVIDHPKYLFNVIIVEQKIIGYILLMNIINHDYELHKIAIHEDYRRQNYASKLFESLSNQLILGSKIILEVGEKNNAAIEFYKSLGFETLSIRKNYYSPNESAIIISKII